MEREFKVLMHCGRYVDANMLEKGIYTCSKPFIYAKDETIETISETGRLAKDMTGALFISEKYFDNLKQCLLVSIFIVEAESELNKPKDCKDGQHSGDTGKCSECGKTYIHGK